MRATPATDGLSPSVRRRSWLRQLAAGGLASCAIIANGQDWPSRPIKIVVPFAAGGTTDLIARLIATPMSQQLGQPVLIENRPGAAGLIGADAVAKAAPDGYTLLMANISYPIAILVADRAKRMTFETADLQGVSIVADVPLVITAPSFVPAKDLRELAGLVKRNSGVNYAYGSTGPGSYMHVFGEWFQQQADTTMTHVPFKGTAPMKQEMLAGRIHMGGDQLSSSLADVRAGTLKALAVTSPKRSPALPDTPTTHELGFTGMETEGWNGLLASRHTPANVVVRIEAAVTQAVRQGHVRQRLFELGAEPRGSGAAEMNALLKKQFTQYGSMVSRLQLD